MNFKMFLEEMTELEKQRGKIIALVMRTLQNEFENGDYIGMIANNFKGSAIAQMFVDDDHTMKALHSRLPKGQRLRFGGMFTQFEKVYNEHIFKTIKEIAKVPGPVELVAVSRPKELATISQLMPAGKKISIDKLKQSDIDLSDAPRDQHDSVLFSYDLWFAPRA